MVQKIVIAHAEGEESLAEQLAPHLRKAGYEVAHRGTVLVGESFTEEASKALGSGGPVVLCATVRACGTGWAHFVVNASKRYRNIRVFPVRMEKDAYLQMLAHDAAVAEYWENPVAAMKKLLSSLRQYYPLDNSTQITNRTQLPQLPFLDRPAGEAEFDQEALDLFRSQIRDQLRADYPAALPALEFLRKSCLMKGDELTNAGLLLFGVRPFNRFRSSIVSCVVYRGRTRTSPSHHERIEGNILDQISRIHDFIVARCERWEMPSGDSPYATTRYSYPMVCVREIVANALVHREYEDDSRKVHVRLFSDRLEIVSPGAWQARELPQGKRIRLDELETQSIRRNPRLAEVLSWTTAFEGEGGGIPRAIEDCLRTDAPVPVILETDGFVVVTIRPSTLGQEVARVQSRFDAALSGVTWSDTGVLNVERLSSFADFSRERARGTKAQLGDVPHEDLLKSLGLIVSEQLTNAGLLLFGANPQAHLPQAQVRCTHFRGTTKTADMVDHADIGGDLLTQIEEAYSFLSRDLCHFSHIDSPEYRRTEEMEIPTFVLREAIVNAVAHRDYSSSAAVQVFLFEDRLEIWNPGRLPDGLTPKLLLRDHLSIPHNPQIFAALIEAGRCESIGSGTTRMMHNCIAQGLPSPEFREESDHFVVVIQRP